MKIAQVNAYHVRPRWGFVEIITDDGLSGWGEAVLEGHTDTVLECVHEMTEYLIGKDPGLIEDIWTTLYRAGFYRGGGVLMSAIAGIDQALWDIKGKHFNAPVNELIGGRGRDRIRVYSWIGGDRPSEVAEAARQKQKEGFTAIKMNATSELQFLDSYAKIDAAVERVASIREACGRDFGIAVDFHGRVHKPMAKILAKKLEESIRRSTRERLTDYLSHEYHKAGERVFSIPLNRQDLADFLFVDRSALSAELCKMRDEGLLKFDKSKFELLIEMPITEEDP